ncbi:hypothetical protein RBB50_003753 [Rhinocladiella similis]
MAPTKCQSKRKGDALNVPQLGEDAAERKRVLNVLAQRRYRQRRKEHLEKLEAQLSTAAEPWSAMPDTQSQSHESRRDVSIVTKASAAVYYSPQISSRRAMDANNEICSDELDFASFLPSQIEHDVPDESQILIVEGGEGDVEERCAKRNEDLFATFDEHQHLLVTDNQHFPASSLMLPSLDSPSTSDPLSIENSASWSLTPLPADSDSTQVEDFQFPSLPVSTDGGAAPVQHTNYTFPDEAHIQVPELALLRGCMSIANRLHIQDIIWSLTSLSPFPSSTANIGASRSSAAILYGHLPQNLRPTQAQLSIPHHPAIDLLPWPSVRDRLIHVLAQPPEYRPTGAKSPTALVDFVYDIEDPAEGVRVTGSDPYDARNWEVGEKVFRGWWWCFDREIVTRTNELRRARGAATLGCGTMGSVVGDVD